METLQQKARKRLAEIQREKARQARIELEAKLSEEEQAKAKRDAAGRTRLERWREDPALYALDRFNLRLTPRQIEVALYVAFGEKKFCALKAAGKVGKSKLAALLVFWLAECHGYNRVNALSATGMNVKEVLWAEVRTLWDESQRTEYPLPASAEPPEDPKTGFDFCGCRILGWTAAKGESLGGIGGVKQLFIIDEASSDRCDLLYDGIRHNTLSGKTRMLLLANPTRPTGFLHSLWHGSPEAPAWKLFTLAAAERLPDGSVRALYKYPDTGLIAEDEVLSLTKLMGLESDFVRMRIFGEFPLAGSNSVCSMDWINQATKRYSWLLDKNGNLDTEKAAPHLSEQLHLGVDVARFGDDDSVIYPRRGLLVLDPVCIHGMDTVQLVDAIVEVADRLGNPGEYVRVKIDTTGSAGAYDLLMQTVKLRRDAKAAAKHSGKPYRGVLIEAVPVCVSERATASPTELNPGYVRLRDQLWFAGAYFLRDGGILKPNLKLTEDLLAPTYKLDVSLKYLVESKADVKKRLKRSPDLADAFCMSVYEGIVIANGYSDVVKNKPPPPWGSTPIGGGGWGSSPIGI